MAGLEDDGKDALDSGPEASEPPAPDAPRKRSPLASLLSALLLLTALAAALAYGATTFRDRDERLAAIADYVDEGVAQIRALISADDDVRITASGKLITPRTAPTEPVATRMVVPPGDNAAAEPVSPSEAPPVALPPQTVAEPVPARPDLAALEQRLAAAEDNARRALAAAQDALAAAKAVGSATNPAAPADALSGADIASALEGRVDTLTDQIAALRAQLEAPKSDARAAPEQSVARSEGAGDASTARVILAYALQRELEAGRPYADEIAALERLGVDPATTAAAAAFAERGAPTGAALRQSFAPIAKKLRMQEAAQGGLTEHLLQGAGKLVRVRPIGQGESEAATADDRIARIEAALSANDIAGASRALEALPEAAKADAKDFADLLHRREEAAREASELLHGAIVALGGAKK